MYLLDTNVVSELRKTALGRGDAGVAAWEATVSADRLFLSVMVVFELELGILLAERRDPVQGATLRGWLDRRVLPSFSNRILPATEKIARQCAQLHVPDKQPYSDAFIAATALVHGLIVVSRNQADFAPMGVRTINPWEA